ncbi:MAG: hypothetical protein ABR541_04570 [Candidatus Dormibacteria bacterium]
MIRRLGCPRNGGPQVAGAIALLLALTACSGGVTPPAAIEVSCPRALLGLDQLSGPGFEATEPSHLVGSDGDPGSVSASAGTPRPRTVAEVRYFRRVRDLATANGPVDITARASCYPDTGSASRALEIAARARDRLPGELPVAAGPLGDEAHADLRQATSAAGTELDQVTLEWRLSTVVNRLVVRGRAGAFGLSDVLALAARQDENELALPMLTPQPSSPDSSRTPPG